MCNLLPMACIIYTKILFRIFNFKCWEWGNISFRPKLKKKREKS